MNIKTALQASIALHDALEDLAIMYERRAKTERVNADHCKLRSNKRVCLAMATAYDDAARLARERMAKSG